jgi:hypothetical protein
VGTEFGEGGGDRKAALTRLGALIGRRGREVRGLNRELGLPAPSSQLVKCGAPRLGSNRERLR